MQLSKKKKLIALRLRRPLVHMGIIIFSFLRIGKLRSVTDLIPFVQLRIPPIDVQELYFFAISAAVIFVLIGMSRGIYELMKPIHAYYRRFLQTSRIWFMASSFLAYMGFGFVFVNGISRFVVIVGAITAFLLMTLIDTIYNAVNRTFERKSPYSVLVLGDDAILVSSIVEMLGNQDIYQLTLIGIDEYDKFLLDQLDIVLTAGAYDSDLLQEIADDTRIAGVTLFHTNETFFLEDIQAIPSRLGSLLAMEYKPSPLDGRWKIIKRIFDIVSSGLIILILSPFLVIIALIIKLDSKGPALYKQKRVGKNELTFTFIKFRTMYTHLSVGEKYGGEKARALKKELMESDLNVRKGELQKIENDPRVTRVGSFLRKTSLDELPNLFSVFIGTMSLVGPRPHEPFEVDRYKPRQKRLFSVKPGITGYAQIFGRDALSFSEEAKLDLYYIQNRSVMMDIYVLISTLKVVFKGS